MRLLRLLSCLVALLVSANAASPHKATVTFSHTRDVGSGNSVFVVGDHPDVVAWGVTRAVKLRYTEGNVWTAHVGVQAGTQLRYKFIRRSTAPQEWCNAGTLRTYRPCRRSMCRRNHLLLFAAKRSTT